MSDADARVYTRYRQGAWQGSYRGTPAGAQPVQSLPVTCCHPEPGSDGCCE